MSHHKTIGLHQQQLSDIVLKWRIESWNGSLVRKEPLRFVSQQWVRSAQDPCGHRFIHQAYARELRPTPESNSTSAM